MGRDSGETTVRSDWYLITWDAADDLRVVSTGGALTDWRRLSNVFRRAGLTAAQRIVSGCRRSAAPVTDAETGGYAEPVAAPPGSAGTVAAILYSPVGKMDTPPVVGSWEWRAYQADLPPVLHLSATALDLIGVDSDSRDRVVYGPSDLWTRTVSLADVLAHRDYVFESVAGDTRSGNCVIQADDGTTRVMNVVEATSGEGDEHKVRGLLWESKDATATNAARRGLDMALATILANDSQQLSAVCDCTYIAAPIVCKWITSVPRGIGHGASTGQTSGFHPDDLITVLVYLQELAGLGPDDPVPTLEGIRIRWSGVGGGWRPGNGRAYRLHPEAYPTVWVAVGKFLPFDESHE